MDEKLSKQIVEAVDVVYKEGFDAGRAQGFNEGVAAARKHLADMPGVLPVENPQLPFATPIEDLDLTVRSYNELKRNTVNTVGDLVQKSAAELLALKNLDEKSIEEIRNKLKPHYGLRGEWPHTAV